MTLGYPILGLLFISYLNCRTIQRLIENTALMHCAREVHVNCHKNEQLIPHRDTDEDRLVLLVQFSAVIKMVGVLCHSVVVEQSDLHSHTGSKVSP